MKTRQQRLLLTAKANIESNRMRNGLWKAIKRTLSEMHIACMQTEAHTNDR